MPSFYRVVLTNPPTRIDFESHVALGKSHDRGTADLRRMAEGVSVNATLAQARSRARFLGMRFVAEVAVPGAGPISFERTGSKRGHHTLWGDPDAMLAAVVAIVPADAVD